MANEYSIAVLFKLIDELTKPMQKMGLAVQNQGKKISEFGEKFVKGGEKMAKLTAPLSILGGLAIKNFGEADEALARLENAIRIAGKQGSISANGLEEFAKQLQSTTNIEHEATQGAMAMMIQMTNLNEGQIKQITPLLQDWSKAMGVDLGTATQQFIRMMSGSSQGLGRYKIGVTQGMDSTQRFSTAVDYLNKRVKGTAETMAGRGLGTLESLKISFNELAEDIGSFILPEFNKIIKVVKGWVDSFGKLDSGTKKLIITIGLILVAIGPLTMAVGGLIKTVGMVINAFGFLMAHPVVLALVAVAAAITGIVIAVNAYNNRFDDAIEKNKEMTKTGTSLIEEYQALQGKANKNNVEMARMREIQEQLIQINPEFKNSINAITGELDLGTDAAQRFNKAMAAQQWRNVVENINNVDKQIKAKEQDIAQLSGLIGDELKKGAIKERDALVLKKMGLEVDKQKLEATLNGTEAIKKSTNAIIDNNNALSGSNEIYLKNYMLSHGELAVDKEIKANVAGVIKKTGSVDVTVKVASDKGSSALIERVSKKGDVKVNVISDSYLGLAGI